MPTSEVELKQLIAATSLSLFTIFAVAEIKPPIQLKIRLVHNDKAEQKGKELIEGFLVKYDLTRDIFTKDIIIEKMAIPHSDPLLTLNTRTIDDPNMYLATFLHEQIHWFFSAREKNTDKFVALMKSQFPKAPSEKNGGAKDNYSTYLHLGVCYYEFKEAERLLGTSEAKRIFEKNDVYTWVRKQVLEKSDVIGKGLKTTGLVWE